MDSKDEKGIGRELKPADILYFFLRRKWGILALVVLFALGTYFFTINTYVPLYTATASMVVNTKSHQAYEDSDSPSSSDIYLAQKLVSTYTLVLKSNRVMEYVDQKLNLKIPTSVLQSYINLNAVENTQVLYLNVTCPDPNMAVTIANAIIEVAPRAMMETVEIGSVNVLDVATLPQKPTSVHPMKNVVIAAAIGLLVGCGLALFLSLIFVKVKDANDLESSLSIPTLGEIAHVKRATRKSGMLLNSPMMPSSIIESYMMLGTIVRYATNNSNMKKLMITSTLENEGKTITAINLAMALVSSGKTVLLVDCDLRKPSIYRLLGIPQNEVRDLYETLDTPNPAEDLKQSIYRASAPVGLSIIPFISLIDKRKDIFATPAFNNAINIFASQYDYVLFDTAPAYTITDTINLAGCVDGVIYIARQEYASLKIISETVEKLTNVGARMVGCVLNDIKYHKLGSGYAYKYKYYYRYYYKKYAYDHDAALLMPNKFALEDTDASDVGEPSIGRKQ